MFSKGEEAAAGKSAPQAALAPAHETRSAAAPAGDVPSIISANMKVVGNPHADGDIQIDGTVEGDIKSRLVTVGETAHIIGSINAESINVRGKVTGQVSAASMRIARTAKSPASHHRSAQRQAGIRGQGAGEERVYIGRAIEALIGERRVRNDGRGASG